MPLNPYSDCTTKHSPRILPPPKQILFINRAPPPALVPPINDIQNPDQKAAPRMPNSGNLRPLVPQARLPRHLSFHACNPRCPEPWSNQVRHSPATGTEARTSEALRDGRCTCSLGPTVSNGSFTASVRPNRRQRINRSLTSSRRCTPIRQLLPVDYSNVPVVDQERNFLLLLLHISDIHFKHPVCQTDEDPDLYFRTELVAHASEQIRELGDVDVILVTGDIAFRGIDQEYHAATKWLETLATAVGCNKRRIYVIPGNHDVDQSSFETNAKAKALIRTIEQEKRNASRETALQTALQSDETNQHVFASISAYNTFAAKHDCQVFPGRLGWKHTLRIDSRTVLHLFGLTSTLLSGIDKKDTKGNLFMSALQMTFPRTPGAANLIMAHHPPEWMSDQDQLEMRLFGTPNIVLFGHRHVQLLRREYRGSIVFSAGSVNPDRNETGWEPAYNLIELTSESTEEKRHVEVCARQFRWQSNPNGFVPKLDMVTKAPIFNHSIQVTGDDTIAAEKAQPIHERDSKMPKREDRSIEAPPFNRPNVRDLIYRFWSLEPLQRVQILEELGVAKIQPEPLLQAKSYRSALVTLARENRLNELDEAIARREK